MWMKGRKGFPKVLSEDSYLKSRALLSTGIFHYSYFSAYSLLSQKIE